MSNCRLNALLVAFIVIPVAMYGAFSFSDCDGILIALHRSPPIVGALIILISAILIAFSVIFATYLYFRVYGKHQGLGLVINKFQAYKIFGGVLVILVTMHFLPTMTCSG